MRRHLWDDELFPRWLCSASDDDDGGGDGGGDGGKAADDGGADGGKAADDGTTGGKAADDGGGKAADGKAADDGGGKAADGAAAGGKAADGAAADGGKAADSAADGGKGADGPSGGVDTGAAPGAATGVGDTSADVTSPGLSGIGPDVARALDTAGVGAPAPAAAGVAGGPAGPEAEISGQTPVAQALGQAGQPSLGANTFAPGETITGVQVNGQPTAGFGPAPASTGPFGAQPAGQSVTAGPSGFDVTAAPSVTSTGDLPSISNAAVGLSPAAQNALNNAPATGDNLSQILGTPSLANPTETVVTNNPDLQTTTAAQLPTSIAGLPGQTPTIVGNLTAAQAATPAPTAPGTFSGVPANPVATQSFTQANTPAPTATGQTAPSSQTTDTSATPAAGPAAPSAGPGGSITSNADVQTALNTADGGNFNPSTSGAGQTGGASATPASLVAPIPPPTGTPTPTPADGGMVTFAPPPFASDGGNFNAEQGLFGQEGTPGGALLPPLVLPGGVAGPIPANFGGVQAGNFNPDQGMFAVLNNAVDTNPGGNFNPNEGIG